MSRNHTNFPILARAANRVEHGDPAFIVRALNFVSGDAPTTIQLLPAGKVEGRDGRYWEGSDAAAIVAAFEKHDGPIVIDYEHATEYNWDNQPAPAAGWITALHNRDGEIWADVEWTEKAEAMIKAKEYRFISPVFYYSPQSLIILEVISAGLTNQPNLKLTALNRRGSKPVQTDEEPLAMDKTQYVALCRSLGLKDDASIDSVMAAIAANSKAAAPDLEAFVPRADFDAMKTRAENAENSIKDGEAKAVNSQIEALVDGEIKAGKIKPAQRDFYVASCKQDGGVERFKAFAGTLTADPLAANSQLDDTKPAAAQGQLSDAEKAMCKATGLSHEDFIKARDDKAA